MRSAARALGRIVLIALAVDLALLALVGTIGWLLGWRTRAQYADALGLLGLAVIGVGALTVAGAWGGRDEVVGYAASTSPAPLSDRVRLAARDVSGAYRRLLLLMLVAAPLIALAYAIDPR